MKLSKQEIRENAQDWIGASQGLTKNEIIDRGQLREQFSYTIADNEDIEQVAIEIENICRELQSTINIAVAEIEYKLYKELYKED